MDTFLIWLKRAAAYNHQCGSHSGLFLLYSLFVPLQTDMIIRNA